MRINYVSSISLNRNNRKNTKKTTTTPSFTSEVIRTTGKVSYKTQRQIDDFEEVEDKSKIATHICDRNNSSIWRLNAQPDLVMQILNPNTSHGYKKMVEETELKAHKYTENIPEFQKIFGTCETKKGNIYIIKDYKDGKVPDRSVRWDKTNLQDMLDKLANLDILRVYHGNITEENCLITDDNKTNLVDFQKASRFDCRCPVHFRENRREYKVPHFILPSNAQMFEENVLTNYLEKMHPASARSLYLDYLEAKAEYHTLRYYYSDLYLGDGKLVKSKKETSEEIEYDDLLRKYLKPPYYSEKIEELEARKIQLLLVHRHIVDSYTPSSKNYNPLLTIPYYLEGLKAAKNMELTARKLSDENYDYEFNKLCSYMGRDAKYWENILKDELFGGKDNPNGGVYRHIINRYIYDQKGNPPKTNNPKIKGVDLAKKPYEPIPLLYASLIKLPRLRLAEMCLNDEQLAFMKELQINATTLQFINNPEGFNIVIDRFDTLKSNGEKLRGISKDATIFEDVEKKIDEASELYKNVRQTESLYSSLCALYLLINKRDTEELSEAQLEIVNNNIEILGSLCSEIFSKIEDNMDEA